MSETRWMLHPQLGAVGHPHLRDEWCEERGCQHLVLLEAPFMCETHLCGSCGGCKAAEIRDLLTDAQARLTAVERALRGAP